MNLFFKRLRAPQMYALVGFMFVLFFSRSYFVAAQEVTATPVPTVTATTAPTATAIPTNTPTNTPIPTAVPTTIPSPTPTLITDGGGSSNANIFLNVDGIKGESTDAKHKDEIEVISYSWGVSQTAGLIFGGGAGAGKAKFNEFVITKKLDKSSPKLMLTVATGKHIKRVVITLRKAGEKPLEYLKITLEDVLVSSFNESSNGELPTESLSFNYGKIKYEYFPQKPDGTLDAAVKAEFDLKNNKAN